MNYSWIWNFLVFWGNLAKLSLKGMALSPLFVVIVSDHFNFDGFCLSKRKMSLKYNIIELVRFWPGKGHST
jgi:hypothetical protein